MQRLFTQVKERLLKILSFWGDRKLYDKDVIQQLEAALLSGDPNAMLQPPGPRPVSSQISICEFLGPLYILRSRKDRLLVTHVRSYISESQPFVQNLT